MSWASTPPVGAFKRTWNERRQLLEAVEPEDLLKFGFHPRVHWSAARGDDPGGIDRGSVGRSADGHAQRVDQAIRQAHGDRRRGTGVHTRRLARTGGAGHQERHRRACATDLAGEADARRDRNDVPSSDDVVHIKIHETVVLGECPAAGAPESGRRSSLRQQPLSRRRITVGLERPTGAVRVVQECRRFGRFVT